jgi:hypothetical protein
MASASTGKWVERRDSLRVPAQMWVRSYDQDDFVSCEGDLSLGGARVQFRRPPTDPQVEVMVELEQREVRLQGEIIAVRAAAAGVHEARVRFLAGDLQDELALARLLQVVARQNAAWSELGRM